MVSYAPARVTFLQLSIILKKNARRELDRRRGEHGLEREVGKESIGAWKVMRINGKAFEMAVKMEKPRVQLLR